MLTTRLSQVSSGEVNCLSSGGDGKKGKTPMKRHLPFLLVLALLAALLVSCGPTAPGQHSSVTTASARPSQPATGPKGRITWQGFLDPNQTTAAIFSATASGSDLHQLTQPNRGDQDGFPEWSPNGSEILFARVAANGPSDGWVMNADGSGLKQLTHCCCAGSCMWQAH